MVRKHQLRQKSSDFIIILGLVIYLIVIGDNQIWDIKFINIIPWLVILSCIAFLIAFLLKLIFKKPNYYILENHLIYEELFKTTKIDISKIMVNSDIKIGIMRHLKISDGEQKIYINDIYYSPIDIINFETFLQNSILKK